MPTILGANSISGYEISNSLRFNKGDNPQLNLANVGTVTNDKKFTYSVWLKRGIVDEGNNYSILSAVSGNNKAQILFRGGSSNAIRFIETANNFTSTDSILTTAALFRDPSAWYHIVVAYDSTDGTAANRVKIYANGVLQTLSGTTVNENYTTPFNEASYNLDVGHFDGSSGEVYDGYMSEANFIDGQQLAPTAFGETDDNGEWIPIRYTGSYGNNGFFLEFKQTGTSTDASGMGADTSGNGRHFAPTNLAAIDVTTDTPTNNFCTFNPLPLTTGSVVLSEGNTVITADGAANYSGQHGTIGVSNGKWYWEMKALDSSVVMIGALTLNTSPRGDNTSDSSGNGMYYYYANTHYQSNETTIRRSNAGNGSLGNSAVSGGSNSVSNLSDNDIVQIALDMDNNKIYFGLNGTFVNSSNPANGTNSFTLHTDVSNPVSPYVGADAGQVAANFGQPSFAISSGNADADGHGNFEFAVPSGYFALCSKNLAEYG